MSVSPAARQQVDVCTLDPAVGLHPRELDDFAPAFEHEQMVAARSLLK